MNLKNTFLPLDKKESYTYNKNAEMDSYIIKIKVYLCIQEKNRAIKKNTLKTKNYNSKQASWSSQTLKRKQNFSKKDKTKKIKAIVTVLRNLI